MAISLSTIIKLRQALPPRIDLLGTEGVGKSSLASTAESPIFITPKGEKGTGELDVARFPACSTYAEVMECLAALYREKHDYRTVVIDSVSAVEPIVWDQVCEDAKVSSLDKVGGGYGKGYEAALGLWRQVTDALDYLREERGMACILIGHVRTKEFNDPQSEPYTTYTSDLHEKAASHLIRWADAVLFANFKKAVVVETDAGFNKKTRRATGVGERRLYTEKRPAHPGKNRYGLPYELPLDWAVLRQHIDQAQGTAATTTTAITK